MMPPPIDSLISETTNTAALIISAVRARRLRDCDRAKAIPLIIAPSTAAGSVVNQLNHPKKGMSPINRKNAAIRLMIRPIKLMCLL
jgi:hypothetical protein